MMSIPTSFVFPWQPEREHQVQGLSWAYRASQTDSGLSMVTSSLEGGSPPTPAEIEWKDGTPGLRSLEILKPHSLPLAHHEKQSKWLMKHEKMLDRKRRPERGKQTLKQGLGLTKKIIAHYGSIPVPQETGNRAGGGREKKRVKPM